MQDIWNTFAVSKVFLRFKATWCVKLMVRLNEWATFWILCILMPPLEIYWLIRNRTKCLRNDISHFDSGHEVTREKVLNTCLSFVKDSSFQLSQRPENLSVVPQVRELFLYHCHLRKPSGKLVRSYCPVSAPWHFHTLYHEFISRSSLKCTSYCRRILAIFFFYCKFTWAAQSPSKRETDTRGLTCWAAPWRHMDAEPGLKPL